MHLQCIILKDKQRREGTCSEKFHVLVVWNQTPSILYVRAEVLITLMKNGK